jgi:hypothetical protein
MYESIALWPVTNKNKYKETTTDQNKNKNGTEIKETKLSINLIKSRI